MAPFNFNNPNATLFGNPYKKRLVNLPRISEYSHGKDLKVVVMIIFLFLVCLKLRYQSEDDDLIDFNIKGRSEFELMRLINQQCNDINRDSCKFAKYSVDNIAKMIQDTSLKRTKSYITRHREEFTNTSGEYIFIFRAINTHEGDEDFKFLYHHDSSMDGKESVALTDLMASKCPQGECNLTAILSELSDIADTHLGGFYQYKWWNPKTQASVTKRTYVRRLEIQTKASISATKGYFGTKQSNQKVVPIYIASGFSVKESCRKYDAKSISIALAGNMVFIGSWKLLDIDRIINNRTISLVIFTIFNILFLLRGLTEDTVSKTERAEQEVISSINNRATGLAGMTMSLVFFSKEISSIINKEEVFGNFLKLLCASFILSVVSIINITEHMRVESMKYGTQMSTVLVLNALAMTLISVLYVFIEIIAIKR